MSFQLNIENMPAVLTTYEKIYIMSCPLKVEIMTNVMSTAYRKYIFYVIYWILMSILSGQPTSPVGSWGKGIGLAIVGGGVML